MIFEDNYNLNDIEFIFTKVFSNKWNIANTTEKNVFIQENYNRNTT